MDVPPQHTDVVDSGESWPARRRWLAMLAVLAVVAAVIVATRRSGPPAAAPAPVATAPAASGPVVRMLDRPILGITDGWELFGFGSDQLVRIEFARGRLTTTTVRLDSTGPVSLVTDDGLAIVRPFDRVPGYVVHDGQPAMVAAGALNEGGPALPGPDGGVWLPGAEDASMVLVDVDGRPTGGAAPLPPGFARFPVSDGAGSVVARGSGGWYLARASGLTRITTGELVAPGATRWLVDECDTDRRCTTVVIDRPGGARHDLGRRLPVALGAPSGVIAPDGRTAALVEAADGPSSVHLVDLASAVDRRVEEPRVLGASTAMVWSPDGRWLFVAGSDGGLSAVAVGTGAVVPLGLDLPRLRVLSLRS